MLLSTAYLGNIQYYTKLISGKAVIDLHENYQKQSFRNRCDITTSMGSLSLTVPVYQPHNTKVKSCDIRIDHSKKWQHQHLQAIISSYRCSPYFEHYEGELAPFFHKRYEFLSEMNHEMQAKILQLIGVITPIKYSDHYIQISTRDLDYWAEYQSKAETESHVENEIDLDLRLSLSPKVRLQKDDLSFSPYPYYQAFSDRMAFIPNLSIIDLLFSEGPQTITVLENSIR